jgi:hypothetical protein
VRTIFVECDFTADVEKAWWLPRWLDRLLPNVDVEGEKLERP